MIQRSGYETASAGGVEASPPARRLRLRPQPCLGTQRWRGSREHTMGRRDWQKGGACGGGVPAGEHRRRRGSGGVRAIRYPAAQALPCRSKAATSSGRARPPACA